MSAVPITRAADARLPPSLLPRPSCSFNVYVSQPEVKPGCVLRRANFNVLERRGLVDNQQVRGVREGRLRGGCWVAGWAAEQGNRQVRSGAGVGGLAGAQLGIGRAQASNLQRQARFSKVASLLPFLLLPAAALLPRRLALAPAATCCHMCSASHALPPTLPTRRSRRASAT